MYTKELLKQEIKELEEIKNHLENLIIDTIPHIQSAVNDKILTYKTIIQRNEYAPENKQT
ncbi:MAG: hypothetical protein MJ211_13215 [Bacteroidales bacterium]|nr:hypothetical protein [Bacteroidales bacterium]